VSGRLRSGHDRLDALLQGGLPANAINLIIGLPGSGKSIIAQQYLFRNATEDRPGLYLASVSEPFDKVLRYGQSLSFFDPDALGHSVFYEDLGSALQTGALPAALERIVALIQQHRPGLIVIDSFKPLASYAADRGDYRRFLHDIAGRLSVLATDSFWVGEYDEAEIVDTPEFAVADAILALGSIRFGDRETRALRVLKLRGSSYQSGAHAFRISRDGLDVFPRLADPGDDTGYALDTERQSTGVAALDALIGEGIWPGAATIVAGPSGTGKTLMGLHFIFKGSEQRQPGVVATFQENPIQLERIANAYGWTFDDKGVRLMYRSPVDVYLDEWVYELLAAIEHTKARRLLIDSVSDLQQVSRDDIRFREYLYSLVQRCARRGVSVFMTLELPQLFDVDAISQSGVSHISDNVIVLQYVPDTSRLRRTLTVIKTRATAHHPEIRDYDITSSGIVLADIQGANT
jgi:circadian clock protein KaiC